MTISPAIAVRFISAIREGDSKKRPSPATVNRLKRTLRAAFSVAVSPLGYIRENPFLGIRSDRVAQPAIRYVSPTEFTALVEAARTRKDQADLWWESFLTVCYTAGLRYGEALNLTWSDVDFEGDEITVSTKTESEHTLDWTPKDYENRTIPVPSETIALLARLQQNCRKGHAYVFLPLDRFELIKAAMKKELWPEGRNMINNFNRGFRSVVEHAARQAPSLIDKSGKPTVSIHDLRRSAITNWSRFANIQTVMKMAGHSSVGTTQRYYAAATQDQLDLIREASRAAVLVGQPRQSDPKVTQNGVSGVEKPRRYAKKSLSDKELRP